MNYPTQARLFHTINHILFVAGLVLVVSFQPQPVSAQPQGILLASKTISLENRYPNKAVNDVFKDNILLTASYMAETQRGGKAVNWETLAKPSQFSFTLKPGDVFAFHDTAYLPEYAKRVVKTTNAHYNGAEGFKSDGYLMGDGVCHLASLLYWAAKDAGVEAVAPVNHDFAVIPQIDKKYGVAIYSDPNNATVSMQQNLYIANDTDATLTFRITYDGNNLTTEILKEV